MTTLIENLASLAGKVYRNEETLTNKVAYGADSVIAAPSAGNTLFVTDIFFSDDTATRPTNIGFQDETTIFTVVTQNGLPIYPIHLELEDCPLAIESGDDMRIRMGANYTQTFIVYGYEVSS